MTYNQSPNLHSHTTWTLERAARALLQQESNWEISPPIPP